MMASGLFTARQGRPGAFKQPLTYYRLLTDKIPVGARPCLLHPMPRFKNSKFYQSRIFFEKVVRIVAGSM